MAFESRPGWWVTANRYRPAKPRESSPGLLICHAHHTPKEHTELQDMGMTWARQGCVVLIPDQLGHGERRQHPFATSEDGEKAVAAWDLDESRTLSTRLILNHFRISRQDTLKLLAEIQPADWWRTAQHEEFGTVTLLEQVSYFAKHERDRMCPMNSNAAKIG